MRFPVRPISDLLVQFSRIFRPVTPLIKLDQVYVQHLSNDLVSFKQNYISLGANTVIKLYYLFILDEVIDIWVLGYWPLHENNCLSISARGLFEYWCMAMDHYLEINPLRYVFHNTFSTVLVLNRKIHFTFSWGNQRTIAVIYRRFVDPNAHNSFPFQEQCPENDHFPLCTLLKSVEKSSYAFIK